jgi:phosphoribosylformylglycinamidine (FGAM) synthase-like amidotransferase family enzyme
MIPNKKVLKEFEERGQIALQYIDEDGVLTSKYN